LKVTPRTIRTYVAEGRLPASKVGPTLIRIAQDDLDALIVPLPTAGGRGGRGGG
jgi:excisionase family DNA binding protein